MDLRRYLDRIGYTSAPTPTLETLRSLHRCHMMSVPFENLDIHRGVPIVLEEDRFFDKIVNRRRGGFCYELNGLFAALLRGLGFRVTLLSARVYSDGKPGPEFDHMALRVDLAEPWLADVGFGDSFLEPLRLNDPEEQIQGNVRYLIERQGEILTFVEHRTEQDTPAYQFTLQERSLSEFAAMCQWQQTAPQSHFTQKRICSLATPDGRITLSDMKLITTKNGEKAERMLDAAAYVSALRSHFGIELR